MSLSGEPSLGESLMDKTAVKINTNQDHLDEVTSKLDELLFRTDNNSRYLKNLDLRLTELEENRDSVLRAYECNSKYKLTKQSSCESHPLEEYEAHERDCQDTFF